jgi:hypothetical protein
VSPIAVPAHRLGPTNHPKKAFAAMPAELAKADLLVTVNPAPTRADIVLGTRNGS